MKLILTQEVPGLGAPGDVVEVKGGYGRNYLVPQGYAIAWTRGGEKQITSIRQARTAREIADEDTASDVKARLEATTVPLTVRAGAGGRLGYRRRRRDTGGIPQGLNLQGRSRKKHSRAYEG